MLKWKKEICKICDICIKICPIKGLEFKNKELIQSGKCTKCRLCEKYCPEGAIEII